MNHQFFLFQLILTLSVSLLLAGCGGGGSSSQTAKKGNGELTISAVSHELISGRINLNWRSSNAAQYRVLYWTGNETPQEYITQERQHTTPQLMSGTYTILVEAYDELGNSLFSMPSTVEVF